MSGCQCQPRDEAVEDDAGLGYAGRQRGLGGWEQEEQAAQEAAGLESSRLHVAIRSRGAVGAAGERKVLRFGARASVSGSLPIERGVAVGRLGLGCLMAIVRDSGAGNCRRSSVRARLPSWRGALPRAPGQTETAPCEVLISSCRANVNSLRVVGHLRLRTPVPRHESRRRSR
jgi:hypothetical protein